ncbi:MAG: hypothetical protein O7E57_13095 [Gammaproteobacteria bacterium]|nr:hypothetical protein [Gammaproteobacteria bacterium]
MVMLLARSASADPDSHQSTSEQPDRITTTAKTTIVLLRAVENDKPSPFGIERNLFAQFANDCQEYLAHLRASISFFVEGYDKQDPDNEIVLQRA